MWKTQIYRKFYYIKHLLSIFLFSCSIPSQYSDKYFFLFGEWNRAHNSQYQWQHQKKLLFKFIGPNRRGMQKQTIYFSLWLFFFSLCLVPWKIVKMFDLFMWIFVSTMLEIMLWLFMAKAIFLSHTLYHSFPS